MISESKNITKGTHRLFNVVEQKDSSTIVKDKISNETYVSKKIYIPEGTEVALFVKKIALDYYGLPKPWFEYSVVNDYDIGKEYLFDVVQKLHNGFSIEDNENLQIFIPKGFEERIENNKIRLLIKDIDYSSNKLLFQNYTPEEDVFDPDKKYSFEVVTSRVISDSLNLLIVRFQDGSKTYSVKAYDFQMNNLPKSVDCSVYYSDNGDLRLVQDSYSLLTCFYKEGEDYEFLVRERLSDSEAEYFELDKEETKE